MFIDKRLQISLDVQHEFKKSNAILQVLTAHKLGLKKYFYWKLLFQFIRSKFQNTVHKLHFQ